MKTHHLNRDGRSCRLIGFAYTARSVLGQIGGAIRLQVIDEIAVEEGEAIAVEKGKGRSLRVTRKGSLRVTRQGSRLPPQNTERNWVRSLIL